ncbi:MAG: MbnP family protein [Flavobacteriaceae bacterium]
MKTIQWALLLMLSITILSCNKDDNTEEDLTGQKGNLVIKFDNGVGEQDFIYGTSYDKSNGESFKLEALKYIISNIRVTDSKGNTFMYPSADNVFIVDEANANNAGEIWITLANVDAADYTSITFGIGIDQERYALGADGQGNFLTEAQEAGMLWSWATGFRFVRLDGTYSSATVTNEPLNIHMGSVGTALDNYREVTLSFPNTVKVRENKEPEIHIEADILKIFDGQTSVSFDNGYSQVHTDENTTPVIANNMKGMFEVHHVHNE